MQNCFFVVGFYAIVEVEMWYIRANKDKVIPVKTSYVLTNVSFPFLGFNKNQFEFGMKMPEEKVIKFGINQPMKRAFFMIWDNFFENQLLIWHYNVFVLFKTV